MLKATIKLAPGQCGFYDEVSGILLSMDKKEVKVNSGVNTAGLIEAVKAGKIIVVSGSLDSETTNNIIPNAFRLNKYYQSHRSSKPQLIIEEKNEPLIIEEVKEEPIRESEEINLETGIPLPKKKTTKKNKAHVQMPNDGIENPIIKPVEPIIIEEK